MIKGIGTDIIEIERVKQAVERTPQVIKKIFSDTEVKWHKENNMRMESMAGAFSAKEAMSKALGTGFRGFGPKDIEVLKDTQGKPYIELQNGAKIIADSMGITQIFLTISHCKSYATATVVVEGRE